MFQLVQTLATQLSVDSADNGCWVISGSKMQMDGVLSVAQLTVEYSIIVKKHKRQLLGTTDPIAICLCALLYVT